MSFIKDTKKYELKVFNAKVNVVMIRTNKCIAFHQAGHMAGFHLNNSGKNFSTVNFRVALIFKDSAQERLIHHQMTVSGRIAKTEGRYLASDLPNALDRSMSSENARYMFSEVYRLAVECDIVNLLIGPLAEARYIAESDNEPFKQRLIHFNSLHNYGGSAEIELVEAYLQNLPITQQERHVKLADLYGRAFRFVMNSANWGALTQLAHLISTAPEPLVSYQQAATVIDQSLDLFQSRRTYADTRQRFPSNYPY